MHLTCQVRTFLLVLTNSKVYSGVLLSFKLKVRNLIQDKIKD